MALLQTVADHQFAAQVKILKENVGNLVEETKKQNELIQEQNALMRQLLEKMSNNGTH